MKNKSKNSEIREKWRKIAVFSCCKYNVLVLQHAEKLKGVDICIDYSKKVLEEKKLMSHLKDVRQKYDKLVINNGVLSVQALVPKFREVDRREVAGSREGKRTVNERFSKDILQQLKKITRPGYPPKN